MPRGHGIGTATLLRTWLLRNHEGSPYAFYRYMKTNPELVQRNYRVGNYDTVRTLFFICSDKLGLIENVRTQKTEKNRTESFYAVVKAFRDDAAWSDPYRFAYPGDYKNNGIVVRYWRIRKSTGRSVTAKQLYGGSV